MDVAGVGTRRRLPTGIVCSAIASISAGGTALVSVFSIQ